MALSRKNHPRILRSGQSALGCGGRSFDVAFIYPFSTLKKAKRSGLSETCHKCLSRLKGRHVRDERDVDLGRITHACRRVAEKTQNGHRSQIRD